MSFVGKVVVVGVIGAACYWQFVYKKENPNTGVLDAAGVGNPIESANQDYVKHKTAGESAIAEKNATILQDSGGAQRVITQNK